MRTKEKERKGYLRVSIRTLWVRALVSKLRELPDGKTRTLRCQTNPNEANAKEIWRHVYLAVLA